MSPGQWKQSKLNIERGWETRGTKGQMMERGGEREGIVDGERKEGLNGWRENEDIGRLRERGRNDWIE